MTPRQSDVLTTVVRGLSVVTYIGLLALVARGYHTLVLMLIGVIFGISALTFFYDRRNTLEALSIVACIGLVALILRGDHMLVLMLIGVIFGISALAFIYYEGQQVWAWWFPDESLGSTVKRWLRYLLQAVTAAVAYVDARSYINELTRVDPWNFPTALTAFAVLNTLVMWLVVIPAILMVMSAFYAGAMAVAGIREQRGLPETPGISRCRWGFRALGALSLAFICGAAYGLPAETRFVPRAIRIFATNLLVAVEFSYDRTCAISHEQRRVAPLKDRRERQVSMVSIADKGPRAWWIFHHITFSTGTCNDQQQP